MIEFVDTVILLTCHGLCSLSTLPNLKDEFNNRTSYKNLLAIDVGAEYDRQENMSGKKSDHRAINNWGTG